MKASDFNRMTWITQLLPIRKFHITRSSADHLKSKGVSQESPSGRGSSGGPAGSHSAFPAPFPHHLGGERRAEGSPLPASGVQPPPFPGGFPGLPSQALAWTRRSPRSSRQHMHPRPPRFPRRFTRETRAAAAPVPGLEGLRQPRRRRRACRGNGSAPSITSRASRATTAPTTDPRLAGPLRQEEAALHPRWRGRPGSLPRPDRAGRRRRRAYRGGRRRQGGTRGGPSPPAPHVAGLPGPLGEPGGGAGRSGSRTVGATQPATSRAPNPRGPQHVGMRTAAAALCFPRAVEGRP